MHLHVLVRKGLSYDGICHVFTLKLANPQNTEHRQQTKYHRRQNATTYDTY
jgi:hypothetical protein